MQCRYNIVKKVYLLRHLIHTDLRCTVAALHLAVVSLTRGAHNDRRQRAYGGGTGKQPLGQHCAVERKFFIFKAKKSKDLIPKEGNTLQHFIFKSEKT